LDIPLPLLLFARSFSGGLKYLALEQKPLTGLKSRG
jgi:hypothetical protein